MKYIKSFDRIYNNQPINTMRVVCIKTPFILFKRITVEKGKAYNAAVCNYEDKYAIYECSGAAETNVTDFIGYFDKELFLEYNIYIRDNKINRILE